MKKRICQMAALGSALLLAFSAPVQAAAVTTNGTPAAVATNRSGRLVRKLHRKQRF